MSVLVIRRNKVFRNSSLSSLLERSPIKNVKRCHHWGVKRMARSNSLFNEHITELCDFGKSDGCILEFPELHSILVGSFYHRLVFSSYWCQFVVSLWHARKNHICRHAGTELAFGVIQLHFHAEDLFYAFAHG